MKPQPLTKHLKQSYSPVRQFFKLQFPRTASLTQKANLQLQSEATINPGFHPTIYDLIWDLCAGPQGQHSSVVIKDFFDRLDVTVKAIAPVRQRLNDEQEKLLARYCYVLALFEDLYRSKASFQHSPLLMPRSKQSVDELLDIPTDAEIDDLCAMSWLFYDRYHDRLSLRSVLNPTLERCGAVSACHADLIVDGCLLEIIASIKPEIESPSLWQLAGYLLLDNKDKYKIRSVGFYMARQGKLLQWPIADFLYILTGSDTLPLARLRQEFQMLCRGVH